MAERDGDGGIAVGRYVRLADGSSGLVSAVGVGPPGAHGHGPVRVRVILRRDPFDDAPLPPREVTYAEILGPWLPPSPEHRPGEEAAHG